MFLDSLISPDKLNLEQSPDGRLKLFFAIVPEIGAYIFKQVVSLGEKWLQC